ncbi:pectate lyase [Actinoplanes sp. NPDC051411]|uniref:pectate lyase family protein n=1 Tax=Actinoplanes sp. NPDC051411 TaxID=3155522 RepID=UPI00341AC15C
MAPRSVPRRRLHRLAAAGGLAAAVAATFALTVTDASAATVFSSNFESGSTGWSKSGGTWSVVSDGSQVFQQSDAGSARAREFAGDAGWTDYSVQARVKATSFGSSTAVAALTARVDSATKMYRLSLVGGGKVQLEAMSGSTITVLGSLSRSLSTSTWYTLKLTVAGHTISGTIDGTSVGSATDSSISAGRIGLLTESAAARFDDVVVDSSTGGGGTTTPPTTPPTTQPTSPPPTGGGGSSTGLVGWATQGGGTTGGAGGGSVTVTSYADLVAQAKSATTETIRVSGLFSCSDDVRVAANKTIIGVGASSGLTGCGINVKDVSNVIIRNLNISKVLAGNGNGDAIHVDGGTRIWIDHNDLSSDTSHGTDYYDGLVDLTHAADYITVSWNRLHDHIKCSLVGHSDSNASEDTGHLRITYHHNAFINCAERGPRVRFGNPVHVFNNYYTNTTSFDYSYSIATTENAGVLVEGNYFENITDPTHLSEGDSDPGNLVARNNYSVNSGTILTSGSVGSIPYSYTVDTPSSVKSIVTAGAGTGKISS